MSKEILAGLLRWKLERAESILKCLPELLQSPARQLHREVWEAVYEATATYLNKDVNSAPGANPPENGKNGLQEVSIE